MSLDKVGVFYNQSSWTMPDGDIYLIGGQETNNSAIVNVKDETVTKGPYGYGATKMSVSDYNSVLSFLINFFSGACIINDPTYPGTYILTGGDDSLKVVQRYNLSGPIDPYPNLPHNRPLSPLNYGRIEHGCSGYFNSDGGYVSIYCICLNHYPVHYL